MKCQHFVASRCYITPRDDYDDDDDYVKVESIKRRSCIQADAVSRARTHTRTE